MSAKQIISACAFVGFVVGMLAWQPSPGDHMLAERIGAGIPFSIVGAIIGGVIFALVRKKQ